MTRQCGGCTACCRLLPVRSLGKPGFTRCVHQRHGKGCAVYAKLWTVSSECKLWNCRWLGDETCDTPRPDRAGWVIDIMPDFIETVDNETGARNKVEVVQVWAARPDVHRDPALRRWLERKGKAALVRYEDDTAVVVAPPSMSADGAWWEKVSLMRQDREHTIKEIVEALS